MLGKCKCVCVRACVFVRVRVRVRVIVCVCVCRVSLGLDWSYVFGRHLGWLTTNDFWGFLVDSSCFINNNIDVDNNKQQYHTTN